MTPMRALPARRPVLVFALASLAALVALAAPARAQSAFDAAPGAAAGVAVTDDATGFLLNPAAGGVRHGGGLALSWREDTDALPGLFQGVAAGRFGALHLAFAERGKPSFGLSLAGGDPELRLGVTWTSLHASTRHAAQPLAAAPASPPFAVADDDDRAHDLRLGALARPVPWLSIGAVLDHAAQPRLAGALLRREWTAGIGVRPLAWSRPSAHTLGPRLTLFADAAWREDQALDDPRWRAGADVEVVPGVALQGAFGEDGETRIGLALRGRRSAASAHREDCDGCASRNVWTVQTHAAENATVLAGPRERRVAVIRVGGALGDDALGGVSILGGGASQSASGPIHRQLERALEDPLTRGVLVQLGRLSGMAQVEELRPRIARLRRAGKPVVAYLEYGGTRASLYLAAACDRIVTTPESFWAALGLHAEARYWREALEDWGVRIDRSSHGRYKSAYRNYSVDSTSAADRESIERVLDVAQGLFVDAMLEDRRLTPDRLMPALDGRSWRARELQALGVIDSVGYRDDALRILGELAGLGRKPRTVNLAATPVERREWRVPRRIAIVYASGGIASGASGSDLLLGPYLGSETLARQVEAAFEHPEVEAVVLRVDSPGGVSVAADLMYHALDRMKRATKKPLIVSMGGSAASGGYHIALPGDRVYADRFTRTGSIGILTVRYSFEGWNRKHEIRQDDFDRGEYMKYWSTGHDWDAKAQAAADSAIRREYRDFVELVARHRGLSYAEADSAAQGRVWMGEDALARRLIDQIGGLEDAIAEARRRAGIPEGEKIDPLEFRRPRPWLVERLLGNWVRAAWERSVRLPEPGASLHWTDPAAIPVE